MVLPEGDCAGYSDGDVADHRHDLIEEEVGVAAEVREIVDADVQGVVEQSPEEIGVDEQEPDWQILNEWMLTLAK